MTVSIFPRSFSKTHSPQLLMPRSFMVLSLLIAMGMLSQSGYAQVQQSTIHGRLEASNAILPIVRLYLTNENTGEVRQSLSDSEGDYILSALAPGSYRLEAEAKGFQKHIKKAIRLKLGQNLRMNILMISEGMQESVIVTARQDLLEPDATSSGGVIENNQIVNLPLDGRNFLELSLLLPGTVPAAQGSPGSVRGEFAINFSGGREDSNNYILDGVFDNDPKLNSFAIIPPVDAIDEFAILTGVYDAGFGRSGGAQVYMSTKSGTNQIHGTAYEFFRNAALDARNYFDEAEYAKARNQRNQFGFSLGGPIKKDHTFFFLDYEGRRVQEGITRIANVPTELERAGDFSQSIFARPIDPYTQLPFEAGRIPNERISAIGNSIAYLFPLPNRSTAGQNYVSSPILRDREDRFDLRLDHELVPSSKLLFRYSFSDQDSYEPFSGAGFSQIPGYGTNIPRRLQNLMIGNDHVFSTTLINQARFAMNRVASGSFQEYRRESLNQAVGLPELSANARDHGLSLISISGFSPIGDEYNNPQHSTTNVFQFSDTLTFSRAKHLIRSGFEYRALQQNAFRDIQSRGMLTFLDTAQVTGNGLADLLLGFVTYSGGAQLDNHQYLRTKSWNFFIHDSYRLNAKVTLQMGIRYEYNAPPVDRYDRANTYDAESGMLVPVGNENIPRGVYAPDRNNWAPRFGLAWSPTTDMVLHAGYGIYYDQSSLAPGEGLYFNKPYYDFRLYFPLPGLPLMLENPFPDQYPLEIPASALGFDPNLRSAYFQQWNFTFEKQFGSDRLVEIAYVGSKGSKILSARDINQPTPSPMQPNLRPNPQFADIIFLESRGNSSYHSLQARFQQRLHAGISTLASYTFGKSLDDNSTFFASAGDSNFPQNSRNPGLEKGRSNFDVRHRFSIGYSYELPLAKIFASSNRPGILSQLLGGWTTYGTISLQSGQPFTVALLPQYDNSNTGIASLGFGANNRPNRIGTGKVLSPGPNQWFDTNAFIPAEYGSFGNSGRNILDGPGYKDFSLSLIKNCDIRDGLKIQFRTEFFNAFNNVNFDLPDIFWGSPSFGRINSAKEPRRIQFGLKAIF